MLTFSDAPYTYHPPKTSRFAIWLFGIFNRCFMLPGKKNRISGITVLNPEVITGLSGGSSKRILYLPNHSTHSDAEVLMEAQRRVGTSSSYMAAYEVFQRSALMGWVMQKCGAFSVDRDGNDREALKEGVNVLVKGKVALTIFPEGNVYFTNDQVTPFLDGAAFIAMKAQKEVGPESPIHAVPVSIKLTHVTEARTEIREIFGKVAKGVGTEINAEASFIDEVRRIGLSGLEKNLKNRGYLPPDPGEMDLPALLREAAVLVVDRLEEKMELNAGRKTEPIDRIRAIRQAIHRIRTNPDKEPQHSVAAGWADEAIMGLRILSYSGTYMGGTPSMDRMGEVAEKLYEDIYSKAHPAYAERHAYVHFGDPIDLSTHLEEFGKKSRNGVQGLTSKFEGGVQDGLDKINAQNPHPGKGPMIV